MMYSACHEEMGQDICSACSAGNSSPYHVYCDYGLAITENKLHACMSYMIYH
jgi:hypothetical protein